MPLPPPYTSATGPWKGIELCKRLNLILQLVFLPNMWHLKILGCGLPLVLAYLPCSQLGIMLSGRCASISWEWCKVVWFSKVCPEMDSVVNYVAKIKHQWQLLIWGAEWYLMNHVFFVIVETLNLWLQQCIDYSNRRFWNLGLLLSKCYSGC